MKNQLSTAIVLLMVACLSMFVYAQDKKPKTQNQILSEVGFDRTVLLTLIALERNYKFKQLYLPGVHEDDYYAIILNTAKRIALQDTAQVRLPTAPVKKDSVTTKK